MLAGRTFETGARARRFPRAGAVVQPHIDPGRLPIVRFVQDVDVPIAVDRLVRQLWISPRADEWFGGLVERVVAQFDIRVPIVRSRLYDAPDY